MKVTFTAQRCTLYTLTKNAIFYCVFFFLRKMTFCVTSFHSNLGWLNSWCIQKNKTIRVLAHNMTIFPLLFEIRTFAVLLNVSSYYSANLMKENMKVSNDSSPQSIASFAWNVLLLRILAIFGWFFHTSNNSLLFVWISNSEEYDIHLQVQHWMKILFGRWNTSVYTFILISSLRIWMSS